MRMYKIAEGEIPDGFIEITVVIDEKGNMRNEITGRGRGVKPCGKHSWAFMEKLFGTIGKVVGHGLTAEGQLAEQGTQEEAPVTEKPESPFLGGPFGGKGKTKQKEKMGVGMGV